MNDQRDDVRRAYDELAETYAAERSTDGSEIELLDELLARLDRGARVLDAGCGQGDPIAKRLAGTVGVVGLDFSRSQLALASAAVPAADFVRGDMTDLAFEDDSFDAVCALYSIIHVPTEEHPETIAEFARVLRPGGHLLLSTGGDAWEGRNPDWLDSGVEMRWSYPDHGETVEQLRGAGFAVLAERLVDDELGGAFPVVLARLA